MNDPDLIPHLFRTEFRKITAVLCKHFGMLHLEVAEDIAGESFLAALETWPFKGLPANPVAWLYAVASNKAKNHMHRHQLFTGKISGALQRPASSVEEPDIDLSDQNISDSQLQMIFAVCHPSIPAEAQIALALRVLCGFGIDEIASAFLSSKDTINKRLFRAREKLRSENINIELPPAAEITKRLDTVLTTLYLLFSEGYYSETQDTVLREELCQEAIRLVQMLIDNPSTNTPETNALLSLMCFHASRFPARKTTNGELILYDEQDESLWDQQLIARGAYHLHKASVGDNVSRYHLEAGIAYWHTVKTDATEKWENILQLYNQLLLVAYSPVAALNRTFALAKANGKQEAIIEAGKLQLHDNLYFHMLLGELYSGSDDHLAKKYFQQALSLAKTEPDKRTITRRIEGL